MHHEGVDSSLCFMTEDLRKRSHNLKPMFLPDGERGRVGSDYQVELNSRKTKPPGFLYGCWHIREPSPFPRAFGETM
jgi:hypothetical protein